MANFIWTVRGSIKFIRVPKHVLARLIFEKVDKDLICMGSAYAATKELDAITAGCHPLMWCAHIMLFDKASLPLNIKRLTQKTLRSTLYTIQRDADVIICVCFAEYKVYLFLHSLWGLLWLLFINIFFYLFQIHAVLRR